MGWFSGLARGLDDLAELAAPRVCGGCGRVHQRWCTGCATWLRTALAEEPLGTVHRPLPDFPDCWSALTYDGPLVRALPAYKDDGRVDLQAPLATVLRHALRGLFERSPTLLRQASAGRLLVVCVPSSDASVRRRGRRPLTDLVQLATAGTDLPVAPPAALRFARKVDDQAGLSARRRAANLRSAMRAAQVEGRACVLVDDVVTSGATLAEAARALRRAGALEVHAVTMAAAQLRPPAAHRIEASEPVAKFPIPRPSHPRDMRHGQTSRFMDGGPPVT